MEDGKDTGHTAIAADGSDHRGACLTSIDIQNPPYAVLTTAQKCRLVWGTGDVWVLVAVGYMSCGLHTYLWIVYGGLNRRYTFIFLGFSILLGVLSIAYTAKAISMVCSGSAKSKNETEEKLGRTFCSKVCTLPTCLSNSTTFLRNVLAVNGKYYLIKLHILEFSEHLMQAYNYTTVYTCQ